MSQISQMGTPYNFNDNGNSGPGNGNKMDAEPDRTLIPVWYKPWILQFDYTRKSPIKNSTIDTKKMKTVSNGWQDYYVVTKLLQADIGVAHCRTLRGLLKIAEGLGFLPTEVVTNKISDGVTAGVVFFPLADWKVQILVEDVVATSTNWYGKYQMNSFTNQITALEYYGSDQTQVVIGIKVTERIVNGGTNEVIATRTMNFPTSQQTSGTRPTKSFGKM